VTVIDPTRPLRVVRANNEYPDPAVDWERTPREEYRRTRDEALLVLIEGKQPAWFSIRRLDPAMMLEALDTLDGGARISMAFRAGVFAVEPPGEKELKPTSTVPSAYGQAVATAEWVKQVRNKYGLATVEEMGVLAYRLGRLPEDALGPFV